MRAVIVSVDFADLLAETLPRNRHHWSDVLVVTTPQDDKTAQVAQSCRCEVFRTSGFYAGGASFNKFLAMEEALNSFGREGWMCFVDADTIWPQSVPELAELNPQCIYSFKRRHILADTTHAIPLESEWDSLPIDTQDPDVHKECMGFTQIFHCSSAYLGKPPWHKLDLTTAALGDSLFQFRWPLDYRKWINRGVLHLGNYAENWCGRVSKYRDGSQPALADRLLDEIEKFKKRTWIDDPTGK